MSALRASIVIPYSQGARVLDCLRSVFADPSQIPGEVFVVNDATRDGWVLGEIRKRFPSVKLLENEGRRGFAGAINTGLRWAHEEFIVLLNDDVVVPWGWLSPLLLAMDRNPQWGACGPKLVSLRDPRFFDYSGGAGGLMDRLGFPFTRGRIFSTIEPDEGQYDHEREAFWISGAAFVLRAQAYREVGPLDEIFGMQMEEIDLCWRLHLRGFSVGFCSNVVVRHLGGYSLPLGSVRKNTLNHRNNLLLLVKNLSWKECLMVLPQRLAAQWLVVLYPLLRPLEWRQGVGSLLALVSFPFFVPSILKGRRQIQRRKNVGEGALLRWFRPSALPWRYFALGQRTASEVLGVRTGEVGGFPADALA